MTTYKWGDNLTQQFIRIYKKCECLWNFNTESYKDKDAREIAYNQIIYEMNLDQFEVYQVKRKIKAIRDTYSAEKSKVMKSISSGCPPDKVYKPRLIWYNEVDAFLGNRGKRKTFRAPTEPAFINADHAYSIDESSTQHAPTPAKKPRQSPFISSPQSKHVYQPHEEDLDDAKLREKSSAILEKAAFHLDEWENYKIEEAERDDAKIFSETWAVQFRKLKPAQQLYAKRCIDEVLYQGAFDNLNAETHKCLDNVETEYVNVIQSERDQILLPSSSQFEM